jgi:hypothetical protein
MYLVVFKFFTFFIELRRTLRTHRIFVTFNEMSSNTREVCLATPSASPYGLIELGISPVDIGRPLPTREPAYQLGGCKPKLAEPGLDSNWRKRQATDGSVSVVGAHGRVQKRSTIFRWLDRIRRILTEVRAIAR